MIHRRLYTEAQADPQRQSEGVAVVGSFQTLPATDRPFKVRGVSFTPKTRRDVVVSLTEDEARKLVRDWVSFGLELG